MSIAESVTNMIKRYGNEVTVTTQTEQEKTFGFVQPLRYKSKMYLDGTWADPGYCDGSHYIYIGLPCVLLLNKENTAVITCNSKKYVAGSTNELYMVKDTPLYLWSVLTPYKEE